MFDCISISFWFFFPDFYTWYPFPSPHQCPQLSLFSLFSFKFRFQWCDTCFLLLQFLLLIAQALSFPWTLVSSVVFSVVCGNNFILYFNLGIIFISSIKMFCWDLFFIFQLFSVPSMIPFSCCIVVEILQWFFFYLLIFDWGFFFLNIDCVPCYLKSSLCSLALVILFINCFSQPIKIDGCKILQWKIYPFPDSYTTETECFHIRLVTWFLT